MVMPGVLLAAVTFALGLASARPSGRSRPIVANLSLAPSAASRPDAIRMAHAVEVLSVLDGDTFEARVNLWPGLAITTRVRLRGIDAPELRARCEDERAKAVDRARGSAENSRAGRGRHHPSPRSTNTAAVFLANASTSEHVETWPQLC